METKIVDTFKYSYGDAVKCISVTEDNHEKLRLGNYYVVIGRSYDNGNQMYSVKDLDGRVYYTMDRFVPVPMQSDDSAFCGEDGDIEPVGTPVATEPVDNVNHPAHYTKYSMEVIDLIEEATEGVSGIEAVCLANVIKYTLRYQFKNGIEDLKKARFYLDKMIKHMES